MKQDLLLEIGCEELPTHSLLPLSSALQQGIQKQLIEAELEFLQIRVFVTPRRLAVLVSELSVVQPARYIERQGPSIHQAYDQQGNPTPACEGFARSCGVSMESLIVKETSKGKYVCCSVEQIGAPTSKLLPDLITEAIRQLPIAKLMRWGKSPIEFVRPVHWVVLMLGSKVVSTTILGKSTGRITRGHRFLFPEEISLSHPQEYLSLLYSPGKVIADYKVRQEQIRADIEAAVDRQYQVLIKDSLLDEVTALVEWPVILQGRFDPDFLAVPQEVLITAMETHQKCFAVIHRDTRQLEPFFIMVSNIQSKDPFTVITGNERVIRARLSDATFFYNQDLKHSLTSRLKSMEHVIFHHKLGSLSDKAWRISELARLIAAEIEVSRELAAQAGLLAKCDLMTTMVGEFPNLQGIMGYYYALHDQLGPECALAIKEHYYPRFSGDILPSSHLGCTVALADRLDTLVGILGIHLVPTGEKDPFALRRAALGVLRLLIEKELSFDLMYLLEKAAHLYTSLPNVNVVGQAFDFVMGRLKFWYIEQGVSAEVFAAVQACQTRQPLDFDHRIQAVCQFQTLPEADALAAANKRVSNILKKQSLNASDASIRAIDPTLFEYEIERDLAYKVEHFTQKMNSLYRKGDYIEALCQLAELKEPVDLFFDQVMVMVENNAIRNNRLALLSALRQLFIQVADISLLSREK